MKTKSVINTLAASAVAVAAGIASSPSGQQVIEQTAQSQQTVVKTQQNRTARAAQQQAQEQSQKTARSNQAMNPYTTPGSDLLAVSNYGMSPKEYGLYLARTGKDKQNRLKRKHYAKARS